MVAAVSKIPEQIRIGVSYAWTFIDTDYPTATWTLSWEFANQPGDEYFAATVAETAPNTYTMSIGPTNTQEATSGYWEYQARMTDGTDTIEVARGFIELLPDITDTRGRDRRSMAAQLLEILDQALLNNDEPFTNSISIGGQAIADMDASERWAWRQKVAAQVAREQAAERARGGLAPRTKVRVQMI